MDINELRDIYSEFSNNKLLNVLYKKEDYEEEVIILVEEILNSRGGIEKIKNNVNKENVIAKEKLRIKKEVYVYYSKKALNQIEMINSDLLPEEDTKNIINNEIKRLSNVKKRLIISNKEYAKCTIIGFILATILGVIFGITSRYLGYYYFIFQSATFLLLERIFSEIILKLL